MRPTRIRSGIAMAAIAVLCLPIPAYGSHEDNLPPLIAEGPPRAVGWESFIAYANEDSVLRIGVNLSGPSSRNRVGIAVYDNNNAYVTRFSYQVRSYESQAIIEQDIAPGVPNSIQFFNSHDGQGGMGTAIFLQPDGTQRTYKILVYGLGQGATWRWDLRGTEGASIGTKFESGSTAGLFRARDFSGGAHAEVAYASVGMQASALREYRITVTDTLIFSYDIGVLVFGVTNYANVLTYTKPSGALVHCLQVCSAFSFVGPNHHGPGDYAFQVTGASTGVFWDVDLVVLDARLPD